MTTHPFSPLTTTANGHTSVEPLLKSLLNDLPEVAGKAGAHTGSIFTEITSENDRLKNEMKRRGFEEAKLHRADDAGLQACLLTIFEAFKHASTEKWQVSEREKLAVEGQMREWQTKNEELQRKLGRLQENEGRKMVFVGERIKTLQQSIQHITDEALAMPAANILLKSLAGIVFFFLTIGLFVFYVSASYRAFFPVHRFSGDTSELERILQDSGIFDTDIFLSGIYALYPVFVPFIFISFGIGLHFLADNIIHTFRRNYTKGAALISLLLVTLLFDGIIAYCIHRNIHVMKELMGEAPVKWYQSEHFWLVICCGFISCLLWSLIFHGLQTLRNSTNPALIRQNRLNAYRLELAEAEKELAGREENLSRETERLEEEMSQNRLKIVQSQSSLYEEKELITYNGKLKLCLDAYFSGWMQYVNAIEESSLLLQQVFKKFIDQHFTRSAS